MASDSVDNEAEITSMRKSEDAAFFSHIEGVASLLYLDRLDAPLRLGIPDNDVFSTPFSPVDFKEVEFLQQQFDETAADTLVLAPLSLGHHIDHRVVMAAAIEMMRGDRRVCFYEDLPYAASMSLDAIDAVAAQIGILASKKLVPFRLQTRVPMLLKIEQVKCYASQADDRTLGRIVEHGSRFGGRYVVERLWGSASGCGQLGLSSMSSPVEGRTQC
jgi:LmbE family N-acetylglucosaminyl deacetylase